MKRLYLLVVFALFFALIANSAMAITSAEILSKVKTAESKLNDVKAEMVITSANKGNVMDLGEGYSEILNLQKGVISYKKPDKLRMDGFAQGIKASFIQNGYKKLVLASMIRKTEDLKDKPGKRLDTLDFGFLSSRLWVDNTVSITSTDKSGTVQLKFVPKTGGQSKRHDRVWMDPKTLRIIKREKYRGSGEMRVRYIYSAHKNMAGNLPIATTSTLYNTAGEKLGTVTYKSVQHNVGLADSLFSLTQR
ncbi:MAG: hypothetical protein GX139_01080 [Armatimonadetes bacterium]|jgi:outer membrane lipoprotein-sorting protein|nr:hypothetical protein [Armatimonadota bacterium]